MYIFLYVLLLIDSYYRISLDYIMFVFSDFEFIYLYLMFIVLRGGGGGGVPDRK